MNRLLLILFLLIPQLTFAAVPLSDKETYRGWLFQDDLMGVVYCHRIAPTTAKCVRNRLSENKIYVIYICTLTSAADGYLKDCKQL